MSSPRRSAQWWLDRRAKRERDAVEAIVVRHYGAGIVGAIPRDAEQEVLYQTGGHTYKPGQVIVVTGRAVAS